MKRGEAAEWEVGDVGNDLYGQSVDQIIINPVGDIVEVLHAHDRRDRLRIGDLRGGDGAETEVPDEPLLLQFGERLELLRDRPRFGAFEPPDAQVHHIEHVEAEVPQVVVDLRAQLRGRAGVQPAALLVAAGSDLRDDVQAVWVGRERLADDLIRDDRPVGAPG